MPALRHPLKRRRLWISIAAVALAAAAIFDWTRPPQKQVSVRLYEWIVIGGYRAVAKPLVSRFVRCRYVPSCSDYSRDAMRMHGTPKGLWLTMKRLLRCTPGVPFPTFDFVPPAQPPKR